MHARKASTVTSCERRQAGCAAGTLSHAGLLAAGLALVLCLAAGCGSVSTDTGGAGGVVTLGPRPIGGDAPGAGDQADSGDTSADADEDPDGTGPDDGEPIGDDGGSDVPDADDSANDVSGDADGDNNENSGPFDDFDACAAVSGRGFLSGSNSLSFPEGTFIWITPRSDNQGTFDCAGLELTGVASSGEVFTGSYDPLEDVVFWEGSVYRPAWTP